MELLDKYLPKKEFDSYEDFYQNFKINIPENFNFAYDVIDVLAKEKGEERAFQWRDERGAEESFTFTEIKNYSNKAANVLKEYGIGKGDRVMLILKRRWEFWPVLLAIHRLGAIAVPATHHLSKKDIVYRCSASDIKGIICIDDHDLMHTIDETEIILNRSYDSHDISHLRFKAYIRSVHTPEDHDPAEVVKQRLADKIIHAHRRKAEHHDSHSITDGAVGVFGKDHIYGTGFSEPEPLLEWIDFGTKMDNASHDFNKPEKVNSNEDIMLIYFTSGTTGTPKMVHLDFTYPLNHIITAKYWFNIELNGLHYSVADTGWAKSTWGCIYGPWLFGAGIFIYDFDNFNPSAMLEIFGKYKITSFCAPPTVYRCFINEDLKKFDLSSLKTCTVAGEPLNPVIYNRFFESTGLKLRECYGQTELSITLCSWPWLEPKPGSMGKPAPGYDLDILREDGAPCSINEEGELVVRTDKQKPLGMFNGYYRDKTLTTGVWRDNVYHTGDVVWKDEDGYYRFAGRSDDMIESAGYKIGTFEVESALMEHPAVLECAVTGAYDADHGAKVIATAVPANNYPPSDELVTELQNHVKKTLAPYKCPQVVNLVNELPKTISGKIRRVQIREESKQF